MSTEIEVLEDVKPKKKRVSKTSKVLQEAEYNARIRDEMTQNGGYTQTGIDEMQEVTATLINQIESSTGKTVSIHSAKPKSRVRFAQIIQENMHFLNAKDVLTTSEKAFLFDITALIGFKTNALVKVIDKVQMPLTQEEIAKLTGRTRPKVNQLIKGLIEKGILAKAESGLDGNALSYVVFVNPNIILNGDKLELEEGLKLMFRKPSRNKFLKDLPVKLFK